VSTFCSRDPTSLKAIFKDCIDISQGDIATRFWSFNGNFTALFPADYAGGGIVKIGER